MRVTDGIAGSSPEDIAKALPYVSAALKRDENNLAIQAEMPLFVISRRPDGGALLRTRISEIAELLNRPDPHLSGGAVEILRNLMSSDSDLILPIIIGHLNSSAKPDMVKVTIVSILLDFRRNDPQAMEAVNSFLDVDSEEYIRIATLQTLGTHRITTPQISEFALLSLQDHDKHVKVAAIDTVHALGSKTWDQALPVVSRMALDPDESAEVRSAADRALHDTLMTAPRQ